MPFCSSIYCYFLKYSPGSPSHTDKKIQGIPVGKEGVHLSPFADDMILLHIESHKDATHTLKNGVNQGIQ